MAACQETGDREFYRLVLAYYDFTNLAREGVNVVRHAGIICGDNAFRKRHVGELSFEFVTFADTLVQALNLASHVFLRIFAFSLLRPLAFDASSLCAHDFGQGQGRDARRDNILWLAQARKPQ